MSFDFPECGGPLGQDEGRCGLCSIEVREPLAIIVCFNFGVIKLSFSTDSTPAPRIDLLFSLPLIPLTVPDQAFFS